VSSPDPRSSLRLRTLLVVAAAVVFLAPAVPATASPSPVPPRRGDSSLSVGTFNINASQRFKVWRKAVYAFRTHVSVAGLQEVNSDDKRAALRGSGWGAFWPSQLGQNPVIWDQDRFELVAARGAKIAKGRYVGHEQGDPYRKASWATVVRLREPATRQLVSVVNVHLVPGAVQNGDRIRGHRRLYRLYVDQVRGLDTVIRTEKAWATGPVLVTGDFNDNYLADKRHHRAKLAYSRLHRAGLVSAWEARDELKPGHGSGTRGGSYLDNVWSEHAARRVAVLRDIRVSDHYPVVATYPEVSAS
jgi:endonuclease/exonuclease/phosphatase family metal-dependent hydrolase